MGARPCAIDQRRGVSGCRPPDLPRRRDIALQTNRQNRRRSCVPGTRRPTAERLKTLNRRQCEIFGLVDRLQRPAAKPFLAVGMAPPTPCPRFHASRDPVSRPQVVTAGPLTAVLWRGSLLLEKV